MTLLKVGDEVFLEYTFQTGTQFAGTGVIDLVDPDDDIKTYRVADLNIRHAGDLSRLPDVLRPAVDENGNYRPERTTWERHLWPLTENVSLYEKGAESRMDEILSLDDMLNQTNQVEDNSW